MYGIIAILFVSFIAQGKPDELTQNKVLFISRVVITNVKPENELVTRNSVVVPVLLAEINPQDTRNTENQRSVPNAREIINAPLQGFFLSRNRNTALEELPNEPMDKIKNVPKNTLCNVNNNNKGAGVDDNDKVIFKDTEKYDGNNDEKLNAITSATLTSTDFAINNETTTEIVLDERASFDGDKCPTGFSRVSGICVKEE